MSTRRVDAPWTPTENGPRAAGTEQVSAPRDPGIAEITDRLLAEAERELASGTSTTSPLTAALDRADVAARKAYAGGPPQGRATMTRDELGRGAVGENTPEVDPAYAAGPPQTSSTITGARRGYLRQGATMTRAPGR